MTRARAWLVASALVVSACSDEDVSRVDTGLGGPTFPRPTPLALPKGKALLVSDYGGDTVSVVSLATHERVAVLPVGVDPVDVDGPHHLAYASKTGALITAFAYPAPTVIPGPHASHGAASRPGRLARYDLATQQLLGTTGVDANPGDVVLSADGSRVVVSHFDLKLAQDNATQPIDQRRARVVSLAPGDIGDPSAKVTRLRVCIAPHGIALAPPDGRVAFVACYGEDTIAVLDLDQGAVLSRVAVGPAPGGPGAPTYGPYSAVLSPSGDRLLVGNTVSRSLSVMSIAGEKATFDTEVQLSGAAYFPAVVGGRVFVPTQGPDRLVELSADLTPVADIALPDCKLPHEVDAVGEDELVVVCEGDHVGPGALVFVRPSDHSVITRVPVGVYPDRAVLVELP